MSLNSLSTREFLQKPMSVAGSFYFGQSKINCYFLTFFAGYYVQQLHLTNLWSLLIFMKCFFNPLMQQQRSIFQHREFHFHFPYQNQSLRVFFCLLLVKYIYHLNQQYILKYYHLLRPQYICHSIRESMFVKFSEKFFSFKILQCVISENFSFIIYIRLEKNLTEQKVNDNDNHKLYNEPQINFKL